MIPMMHIIAWGSEAPWADPRQIEQDLIISRALVDLFNDPLLKDELKFRGGTALNKLHFEKPLRYSEDIDLVRTTSGPIGPILDQIRAVLEPWLGKGRFDQSRVAPKLLFSAKAEDQSSANPLRLKVEINTRETDIYDAPLDFDYRVENPWFTGETVIPTFSNEEMLATKLRALLQRNKGRDLIDLSHALEVMEGLDTAKVIQYFQLYLQKSKTPITRPQAEERMFEKLQNPNFLSDIRPLLSADAAERLTDEEITRSFESVFSTLIVAIPGKPWARSEDMKQHFDILLGS